MQDILQGTEGMYSVNDEVGLLITAGRHRYSSLERFWLLWRSFGSLLAGKNKYFWNGLCEGAELQKLQFPCQESHKHQDSALSLRIRILQPPTSFVVPVEGCWDTQVVKLQQILAKACSIQLHLRLKKKKKIKILVTMNIFLWPDMHLMGLTALLFRQHPWLPQVFVPFLAKSS